MATETFSLGLDLRRINPFYDGLMHIDYQFLCSLAKKSIFYCTCDANYKKRYTIKDSKQVEMRRLIERKPRFKN